MFDCRASLRIASLAVFRRKNGRRGSIRMSELQNEESNYDSGVNARGGGLGS